MINFKNIDWFKTTLLALMVLAGLSWWQARQQDKTDVTNALSAMQAEMKSVKGKDGVVTSSIPIVQTSPKIYLTATRGSDDPAVQRLRAELEALKGQLSKSGAVAVINSEEKIDAHMERKTLPDGSVALVAGDEWYTARVAGDSLRYRSRHEFTVASVKKSGDMNEFIFRDRNPHNTTTDIRAFAPAEGQVKRWGIGPYIGYDALRGVSAGAAVSWHLVEW